MLFLVQLPFIMQLENRWLQRQQPCSYKSHFIISVEFTITAYFWEELQFYQLTLYCNNQRVQKQHLILQHNLAPSLQAIAAGEMAPAWQKR